MQKSHPFIDWKDAKTMVVLNSELCFASVTIFVAFIFDVACEAWVSVCCVEV